MSLLQGAAIPPRDVGSFQGCAQAWAAIVARPRFGGGCAAKTRQWNTLDRSAGGYSRDFTPEQMTSVVSALERVIRSSNAPSRKARLQWTVEKWRGARGSWVQSTGSGIVDRLA